MDKDTETLIEWAESYKPTIKSFQLNESTYVEDVEKSISTLVVRAKRIDVIPVFIAYRDHLQEIKDYLDKNE